jgi:hypothetical protein
VPGPNPYRLQKQRLPVAGERYDVVLEATNSAGPYWIHVKGLATCVAGRVYQLGVLQYENTSSKLRALPYDPGYDGFLPSADYRVSYSDGNLPAQSSKLRILWWLTSGFKYFETIVQDHNFACGSIWV